MPDWVELCEDSELVFEPVLAAVAVVPVAVVPVVVVAGLVVALVVGEGLTIDALAVVVVVALAVEVEDDDPLDVPLNEVAGVEASFGLPAPNGSRSSDAGMASLVSTAVFAAVVPDAADAFGSVTCGGGATV